MPFENLKKQLEANGFTVSVFASGEDAASYLNREIDGKTVGMGGSMTITGLGLKESLGSHNTLYSHGFTPGDPAEVQKLAADAEREGWELLRAGAEKARAENAAAMERAQERLRQKQSLQEYHLSQAALSRAMSRLSMSSKYRER